MDILGIKDIKELFAKHQTYFAYSLGQNYLISKHGIESFVQLLPKTDTIIEVGPGIGTITIHYFKNYSQVILIEKDASKIPLLQEVLTKHNNGTYPSWVQIIKQDVLEYTLPLFNGTFQIIGALPYNIAKRIVTKYLHTYPTPLQLTFILQREVADKYIALPPNETFLSVSAKLFAKATRSEILKKTEFYPSPKVDSRIIMFKDFTTSSNIKMGQKELLSAFIKRSFSNPRKKLRNVLHRQDLQPDIELLLEKRPQELSLSEWENIYEACERTLNK